MRILLADGCDNDGTGIMYDSATTSWIDKGAIVVNIHDRSSAGPGKYYDIYDFVADDVNVMKYFIDAYGVTGNVVLQGNSRGTMEIPLAGIISTAGFFSTIFGFMFRSIFGFEDVLKPLWIRPIDHMTTLPFLGKLNTVFIVAVAFGMFLIIVAMILHIINAAKSKDVEGTWFDANGVAEYHYLRLYGALWFMNNTLEVLHLNRGSEIEHKYSTKKEVRICEFYL